ncbi:hypothetical protein JOQ06_026582, partial [Pogonophryne albipinna]
FSGQQLLRKGINETGKGRERQPGRDRGRGGGRRDRVQRGEEAGQISISRLGFSPMCHCECNCNVTLQGLH